MNETSVSDRSDFTGHREGPGAMPSRRILLLLFAGLSLTSASSAARAETFVVDSAVDEADLDPGDGVCSSTSGSCTLRAALDEANALPTIETVHLPSGTYTLSLGQLEITDDVTLRGEDAATTIVDAAQRSRVVEVGAQGWLIADNEEKTVQLFSRGGLLKQTLVSQGTDADLITAVQVVGDTLYVLSLGALRLYDPDNGALRREIPISSGVWPSDLAFAVASDYAYVLDYLGNRVLRYSLETGTEETFIPAHPNLRTPQSLIIRSGELLITNADGHDVVRFDVDTGEFLGTLVAASSGGLSVPRGLAVGHDGRLYVVSEGTDSVLRYDLTTGAFIDTFVPSGSGGLNTPHELAIGPEGDLYVATGRGNTPRAILRYDGTSGAFLGRLWEGAVPASLEYARAGQGLRVELQNLTLQNGRESEVGVPAGAVYNTDPATELTLESCVVQFNSARVLGGAIYNAGYLKLDRTRVTENHTESDLGGGVQFTGGGVHNNGGRLEIVDSTIDHNLATRGGGIANWSGVLTITNSTVSGNHATARGGGIYALGGATANTLISFSTITDNESASGGASADEPASGGGIYNNGNLSIANSILAGNRDARGRFRSGYAPDCFSGSWQGVGNEDASVTSYGGNLLGVYDPTLCEHASGPGDQRGNAETALDPRLGPLTSDYPRYTQSHGLTTASPAIDAAILVPGRDDLVCPARDQRGASRPVDGDGDGEARCASGALERDGAFEPTRYALFVVPDDVLSTSDRVLAARLADRGFQVTPATIAESTGELATGFDLVIISESVTSSALDPSLAAAPTPILCLETAFLDELGMTGGSWDVDQGAAIDQTRVNMVGGNPISTTVGGESLVTDSGAKFGWGVPATADAILVAELTSAPGTYGIFAYPEGAALAGGASAPAARLAFFAGVGTPERLNEVGWILFDDAVRWLAP